VRAMSEINCDPTYLLTRVNARLAEDLETGRFVTAFVGCLSSSGELRWSSAGHGPMFLRAGRGEKLQVLEPLAPPIGILPELPCDAGTVVQLEPGGCLFVMSDGVFEARSAAGELFETSRVVDLLNECVNDSPAKTLGCLQRAVREWQGNDDPIDDQSVVIVEFEA
jgi:phosphoserine phosphatase RsbU/P